jgi:hypothetical protein
VGGKIRTKVVGNVKKGTLQADGTYVSVEPFHLFRYLDEQAFRYNNRDGFEDKDRFDVAVRQIVGKRLTWNHVTGKAEEAAS